MKTILSKRIGCPCVNKGFLTTVRALRCIFGPPSCTVLWTLAPSELVSRCFLSLSHIFLWKLVESETEPNGVSWTPILFFFIFIFLQINAYVFLYPLNMYISNCQFLGDDVSVLRLQSKWPKKKSIISQTTP